jgi:hypothetical protein
MEAWLARLLMYWTALSTQQELKTEAGVPRPTGCFQTLA